ncbi:MAG TPA: hypothetical protein VFS21_30210 [Roseiflexaceae bacterium]|nr:hypothetical protein [Roseiflexaceae bacterium]
MPISIQLDDYTEPICADLDAGAARVVRETAAQVQAGAGERSAVLYGAQRASIYVSTSDGSSYAEAVADAHEANEDVRVFDEIDAPEDDLTADIAVAVVYAQLNEEDRIAFLVPAAEAEREPFEAAMEAL